jgi:replication factor C subunit 1
VKGGVSSSAPQVRAQGKWGLMPFTNFCSVNAASLMTGRREIFGLFPGERNFSRFPAWLGKNSSTNKGKRLLGELHAHASGALTSRIA